MVDGCAWPCLEARVALRVSAGEDIIGLRQHLAWLAIVAERELPGVVAADLYARFVGWTLGAGERCPVCGSVRHSVMAGVPPRVVPCGGLRLAVSGGLFDGPGSGDR